MWNWQPNLTLCYSPLEHMSMSLTHIYKSHHARMTLSTREMINVPSFVHFNYPAWKFLAFFHCAISNFVKNPNKEFSEEHNMSTNNEQRPIKISRLKCSKYPLKRIYRLTSTLQEFVKNCNIKKKGLTCLSGEIVFLCPKNRRWPSTALAIFPE